MSNRQVTRISGTAIPLLLDDIDTDRIIPARYLRCVTFDGLGEHAFEDDRQQDPGHPFNNDRFAGAGVLVAGRNFGCGSSREHAPWALSDYGIKCVIAPSFADIFFSNCFQNGLLPLVLPEEQVREILDHATANPGVKLTVDLEAQRVWSEDEEISISFEIDASRRHALLNGLDNIGLTLEHDDKIAAFEASHRP